MLYSKALRSESEVRLDGDRFGSYFTATTQAFEEVFRRYTWDKVMREGYLPLYRG